MQSKKVSVRELVAFVHNEESIDNRKQSNHTALEGSKIHRKLQQSMDENYQSEVSLKTVYQGKQFDIQLEGRCDGIWQKENQIIIDEIKTGEHTFEQLEDATLQLFMAQAKIYAYIYALQEKLEEVVVMVRYFCTQDEKIDKYQNQYSFDELNDYYQETMKEYEKWLIFLDKYRQNRQKKLQALQFPYNNYRKGQRELSIAVYRTLSQEKCLFMEAPTGTGKTLSTLFPALKAMGEYNQGRIFYLTAKTITRQVALDTMKLFEEQQSEIKTIEISAKEKICFMNECKCNPDYCPFAKNYYQKQKLAIWDLLNNGHFYSREQISEVAKKYECCPFELSLDLSLYSDVIVCDYNYLFDPQVYLKRFFELEETDSYFLVDEGHNLISRAREMYSKALSLQLIKDFKKLLPKHHRKHHKILQQFIEYCEESRKLLKDRDYLFQKELPDKLIDLGYRWSEYFRDFLLELKDEIPTWLQNLYFDLMSFLKISEYYDDHFSFLVELVNHELQFKIFCLDPAHFIKQKLDFGKGSVLFSATLSPVQYYQNLLVGHTDDLTFRQSSPFNQNQFQVLVADYLPMTYKYRSQVVDSLCELIKKATDIKAGNYFCFFPSFSYMEEVYQRYIQLYPEAEVLIQSRELKDVEKEAFLANFQAQNEQVVLGFCVLGGVFSEGIDLKKNRLIGSIIVSVGLPQISKEQEELKRYFDEKNQQGFYYIYQLPGFNKMMQAAGRVIRTEEDRGVILLIDQRFSRKDYMQLYPSHWSKGVVVHDLFGMLNQLKQFWY
ncbi:ATP-dependent DNA helicase [Enterococcus cecorum]|uniref:ATP-dependent DNA helicase n=1 Tax=Enterococcus cecorum TaxID=44008 RepID=UPI0022DBDACD|nr:ATP-dependent DNA helicase [Enterococcus cecorum]CAI3252093.1 ATP-dependent DNA helicase [Enterococcus cecorum]CAI3388603.1 ATP-dependent DNA helicase [Enterococcus cecorum]CAI3439374.1 ATP-dependent DNA helicase [Enterococcus cecorum]CAI3448032.1 ATP-dependent DNA helicase [Enterococcus cecorum]CAI3451873.1 ATP-dependent DNA helicase [Enterococcus cecorum]